MIRSKEKFMDYHQEGNGVSQSEQEARLSESLEATPQLLRLPMPEDLKKITVTKGTISQNASMIIQRAGDQGLKAYELKAFAKYLETLAKEISDRVSDEATDELANAGGEVGLAGMTLSKVASAGTWSYDHIPEWSQKKDELKEIERVAKLGYELLKKKKIGTGPVVVNPESGEEIKPAMFNPGKDTIKITIAK